ncbi:hypothetical protein ACQCT3_21955, partial [Sutcliffiella horikoshii]|uniref:hypothetical protein n=1 Tax=Sutcliffiella horikoshii TaxID=79883 RepID=UPI003CF2E49E
MKYRKNQVWSQGGLDLFFYGYHQSLTSFILLVYTLGKWNWLIQQTGQITEELFYYVVDSYCAANNLKESTKSKEGSFYLLDDWFQ